MACGGCAKRHTRQMATKRSESNKDLKSGYANLTDRQLKARLEIYKRRYCKTCDQRYECDYKNYVQCKQVKTN